MSEKWEVGSNRDSRDRENLGEVKKRGTIRSRRECWDGKPMVKIGLCVTLVYGNLWLISYFRLAIPYKDLGLQTEAFSQTFRPPDSVLVRILLVANGRETQYKLT